MKSYGAKKIVFHSAGIKIKKNNYFLSIGRNQNQKTSNSLSSGSLLETSNSLGIPKLSFGNVDFYSVSILNNEFLLKAQISHGIFEKDKYLRPPLLHEKLLIISKKFSNGYRASLGLDHRAMWGGQTELHGRQPQTFQDFIKVFFARPGSVNSIYQERENTLGNHLGSWMISIEKKLDENFFKVYYEHPFEDESGARWLLNKFDGRYGISINALEDKLITNIVYEYLNTMNQSGSKPSSDSTYGWDNYFNHYLYQSGWTYNNRMIGNPLFTVGSNYGRYSNNKYIINNRIKAHHIGIDGIIAANIKYKILFTLSRNYGIYSDSDFYSSLQEYYKFSKGLLQKSTFFQIRIDNAWKKIGFSISYANDNGDLLPKTNSFMMVINYKLKFNNKY